MESVGLPAGGARAAKRGAKNVDQDPSHQPRGQGERSGALESRAVAQFARPPKGDRDEQCGILELTPFAQLSREGLRGGCIYLDASEEVSVDRDEDPDENG